MSPALNPVHSFSSDLHRPHPVVENFTDTTKVALSLPSLTLTVGRTRDTENNFGFKTLNISDIHLNTYQNDGHFSLCDD